MKLLVIDGNSIVNRAFFGIKLLTTKDGRFTNAIFGFLNILLKLKEAADPDAVAFAFDLKAPTFRHEMYDEYKAGRKGMPPELAEQMPVLKDLLVKLGYTIVEKEGYEADDILGTLSAAIGPDDHCYVATGDRDSLQLVRDNVSVLLASTKMGPLNALRMALEELPEGHQLIHHSDRGVQYCSNAYVELLQKNGIQVSMTENGDPRENAVAERVNGILKEEWFNREVICSLEKGRERTGEIIRIYNEMRPHMSNDYLTPQQAHQQNGTLRRRWKTYYKKKEELCEQINEVM